MHPLYMYSKSDKMTHGLEGCTNAQHGFKKPTSHIHVTLCPMQSSTADHVIYTVNSPLTSTYHIQEPTGKEQREGMRDALLHLIMITNCLECVWAHPESLFIVDWQLAKISIFLNDIIQCEIVFMFRGRGPLSFTTRQWLMYLRRPVTVIFTQRRCLKQFVISMKKYANPKSCYFCKLTSSRRCWPSLLCQLFCRHFYCSDTRRWHWYS